MKNNFFKISMYLFAALLIVITSCRENGGSTVNYYEIMTDYMVENDLDLTDIITDWIITAHDLDSIGVENFHIIDLRSADDFDAGHIQGAHNTTLVNVLNEAANANGKPIVLVCYTGHTAAYALTALRLSGYSNSKSLKFGMSSWNEDFDRWTPNIGNIAVGHPNWSTTNNIQPNVTFSLPTFTTTATTGEEILAERVQFMLEAGFQGVNASDVLETPTNYFINNYWSEADVNTYGHIVGAYRIKEDLSLASGGFKYLDKDATIVTYCWTGQTASAITAYLIVLGYDAKALKFSANAMIYDQLQSHKWTGSGNYEYVTSK